MKRRGKAPPLVSSPLTVDVNGKSHFGSYVVDPRDGGMVIATSEYGTKSEVLRSASSPEFEAQQLLRLMIEEAAQRGLR